MGQKTQVLKYLQDFGSITPADAVNDLGIYRLSSVIFDLRKAGYNINTNIEESKNRYGVKTNYARYTLEQKPVQTTLL